MTDLEFMDRAEQLLLALEQCCDRINDIINQQKPLHEIWMAAKSGGYHYQFDGQQWQDTKGAGEFYASLSRDATAQAGLDLAFAA